MMIEIVAVIIGVITLAAACELVRGLRCMKALSQPAGAQSAATISVIVPACNEEESLQPALTSLLTQDYPHMEVILVNDRSTDRTGAIAHTLVGDYPQLTVIDIDHLPPGWLGKNHALHTGARQATGDYLLFTDADIIMAPTTVSHALAYMEQHQLDHLAVTFKNVAPGWLLNSMIVDVGSGLLLLFRPWLARQRESWSFMGVGAFNMVQRAAYDHIDGHGRLPMHPIDDLMLGKQLKKAGCRQECLLGDDYLTVHWYTGVGEMVDGLMKNVFALFDFNVLFVAVTMVGVFLLTIVPFWGGVFAGGLVKLLFVLIVVLRLVLFALAAYRLRLSPLSVVGSLLSPYMILYIMGRATCLTLVRDGIEWRGTHYPLSELRGNESLWTGLLGRDKNV